MASAEIDQTAEEQRLTWAALLLVRDYSAAMLVRWYWRSASICTIAVAVATNTGAGLNSEDQIQHRSLGGYGYVAGDKPGRASFEFAG